MGPIFLTLQWLRGCYKGFAPFCAALSVRDPSVRSGEFLFRWRIFIADEIFCRRNFLPADFSPMGYLSLSMSPGVMRRSWVFWCFRGLWGGEGSGVCPFRAVGWGGWGVLVGCVQTRELGAHASPFELYPADKLQWHFACGFDFSLWLPFVAAFAALKGLNVL